MAKNREFSNLQWEARQIEMQQNLSTNKKLALTGAFSALVIVLGITRLGFITFGPTASITILQIPVILAVMLAGLPYGVFVGAVFGVLSLVQAAMNPSGVLDPLFVNPLCSVLPRILLAVVAWAVWRLLTLIPRFPRVFAAGITGFVATFAHTLMVIGSIYIFKGDAVREAMGGMGYIALIGALSVNAVLEAMASTIVCAAVFAGVFVAANKKSKLSTKE